MKQTTKAKRAAFAELVKAHQAAIRGFLRVLGVRIEAVDDLAQETFMVAYRELENFDDDRDFGKWLRGIARNLARNEVRKNARRSRILDGELTEHLLAESERDQSEQQLEDYDFGVLRDCLEELPEKSRQLVAARYYDEWNSTIVGDQFNMTATAVRLALLRIRRQLKSCIETKLANG